MHQSPSTSRPQVNAFINSIEIEFKDVFRFEDKRLHDVARSVVPLITLQVRAMNNIRNSQKTIKEGDFAGPDLDFDDALLVELLNWFKTSFFKWVDKPECDFCISETRYINKSTTTVRNRQLRKEIYQCINCEKSVDFVRYHDPQDLLQSRRGRCGEWANCFTLLCRALGYDARYVLDVTDHVWTEVYSFAQNRWIHCDPCENVLDTPLMYENGWGKKLEYVIAYSKDEVQDVTWRYSSNHKALMDRRKKCTEMELVNALLRLRKERAGGLSEARANFVLRRSVQELVELLIERKPNDNELIGRISGSLNWRLQRGEIKSFTPYIWELPNEGFYSMEYFPTFDKYEFKTINGPVIKDIKGWDSGVFHFKDLFRKEELDWKMVYLARNEGTTEATVSWKFACKKPFVIKKLTLKVNSFTCESGTVIWNLCIGNSCVLIPKQEENHFQHSLIEDHTDFTITAKLSGGRGNTAWQHAQLFRQEMNSTKPAFQIVVVVQSAVNG